MTEKLDKKTEKELLLLPYDKEADTKDTESTKSDVEIKPTTSLPPVSFLSLYKYTSTSEKALLVFALVVAAGHGQAWGEGSVNRKRGVGGFWGVTPRTVMHRGIYAAK